MNPQIKLINGDKYLLTKAIDFMEGNDYNLKILRQNLTNMPPTIRRRQQAARVMYLNNSLIESGICNGTIGVVTDLDRIKPSVRFTILERRPISI